MNMCVAKTMNSFVMSFEIQYTRTPFSFHAIDKLNLLQSLRQAKNVRSHIVGWIVCKCVMKLYIDLYIVHCAYRFSNGSSKTSFSFSNIIKINPRKIFYLIWEFRTKTHCMHICSCDYEMFTQLILNWVVANKPQHSNSITHCIVYSIFLRMQIENVMVLLELVGIYHSILNV